MPMTKASVHAASAVQPSVPLSSSDLRVIDRVLAQLAGVDALLSEGFDSCEVDWLSACGIVELALRDLLALREKAGVPSADRPQFAGLREINSACALLAGAESLLKDGYDSCDVDWLSASGIVDCARRKLGILRGLTGAPADIRQSRVIALEDAPAAAAVAALSAIVAEVMEFPSAKPFSSDSYLPPHLVELGQKAVEAMTGSRIAGCAPALCAGNGVVSTLGSRGAA